MTAGFWWVFALNAVTFAIFVGVLRKVRPLAPVPISNKSRVRDGMLVVRDDRKILVLLLVVAASTLAEDPVLVLGPGLARHAFHVSYDSSGYFLCALGAGCVLSSLVPKAKVAVHTKGDSSSRPAGRLDRDVLTSTVDVAQHRRRVQRGTMGAGSWLGSASHAPSAGRKGASATGDGAVGGCLGRQ